jgi:uncharacterized protein (DUF2267 family)
VKLQSEEKTMSTTFDRSAEKADAWLADMMAEMPTSNGDLAFAALRAGLQSLRDRLPAGELADLASQLPMAVRGLLFEGWRPERPERIRSEEAFLADVRDRMHPHATDPWLAFVSTMRVLERHVAAGEMAQIKAVLPHAIRAIWPEPPCQRTI